MWNESKVDFILRRNELLFHMTVQQLLGYTVLPCCEMWTITDTTDEGSAYLGGDIFRREPLISTTFSMTRGFRELQDFVSLRAKRMARTAYLGGATTNFK